MAPIQRHTIYIRCRPPELWAALTEGQSSRMYYFEALIESSFEPGAALRYYIEPDEELADQSPIPTIEGEVVAVERERSLVHGFRFCDLDEPGGTVRWTLSESDAIGVMRVDVEHEGLVDGSETLERVSAGWPVILSGLKTWLETGTTLNMAGGAPPQDADEN